MFYTVYKTTNLTNGKVYVGVHQTVDPNDNYLGSGKLLKRAIKKYGVEGFKKEVLFVFDNPQEAFQKEAEIVTTEFLAENNTYNLKLGGEGGNPGKVGAFTGRRHTDETKAKIRNSAYNRQPPDADTRRKISEAHWARTDPDRQREHASTIAKARIRTTEEREKAARSMRERHARMKQDGVVSPNQGLVRVRHQCPHCAGWYPNNILVRFHNENCKQFSQ